MLRSTIRPPALIPAALAVITLLAGCAAGVRLPTEAALPADLTGSYRLYLYGCLHPHDLENMALLVDEASPYAVELVASRTSYRVEQGLSGPEARARAKAFVHCNIGDTGRNLLRRVLDPSGGTVAFELKPLFSALETGRSEVLDSTYYLDGGRVRVYLILDPWVERSRRLDQWGAGGT